ncbi:MAG: hypothetical protein GC192_11285 [Bacteroidetes bacterium]|nr:hypothetical protein [Bacteroidota bacterium]
MFKPSNSKNRFWNLIKTYFQTAIFWAIFLYAIPYGIIKIEKIYNVIGFHPSGKVGWVLFIIFSLLGVYSGYSMSWYGKGTPLPLNCPNKLVIEGPYKFVRNPMAIAGIGQGVSIGIINGSFLIVIYSLIGAVLWHLLVRPIEEKDLEDRFKEAYINYKASTKCWVPKLVFR